MKKIIFIITIMIETIFAQAVNFSDYFNLKIGNIYVYNCTRWFAQPPPCNDLWKMRIEIIDTVRFNGIKYYTYTRNLFQVSGTCSFHSFMFPFYVGTVNAIRLDTMTGNIYYYNTSSPCAYSPNETMIDSLNSKLNDTVKIRCVPSPYFYKCIDTAGNKKYYVVYDHTLRREYVRGVGLVNNYYYKLQSGLSGSSEQTLVGRVINGIVYGDTTSVIVGNNNYQNKLPFLFTLSQNYPNPFNPVTKIKYQIPLSRGVSAGRGVLVRLIIYDILGREIETLVNQTQKPGSYEVTWDGSRFASGVYFYRLITDDYTETKKMVLIK